MLWAHRQKCHWGRPFFTMFQFIGAVQNAALQMLVCECHCCFRSFLLYSYSVLVVIQSFTSLIVDCYPMSLTKAITSTWQNLKQQIFISLADVLQGLFQAQLRGILSFEHFNLEVYEYCEKVENGDSTWIVPGKSSHLCKADTLHWNFKNNLHCYGLVLSMYICKYSTW